MEQKSLLPEAVVFQIVVEKRNNTICSLLHIHPLIDKVVNLYNTIVLQSLDTPPIYNNVPYLLWQCLTAHSTFPRS